MTRSTLSFMAFCLTLMLMPLRPAAQELNCTVEIDVSSLSSNQQVFETLKEAGIRASVFVGTDPHQIALAAKAGADRVELYTKPYADMYAADPEHAVEPYVAAARAAHAAGLGVNAGHDLNLVNLAFFADRMPWLDEVSIGHALICDAIYLGLAETIKRYKACLRPAR